MIGSRLFLAVYAEVVFLVHGRVRKLTVAEAQRQFDVCCTWVDQTGGKGGNGHDDGSTSIPPKF